MTCYPHKINLGETTNLQFLSDYSVHTVTVLNADGTTFQTINVVEQPAPTGNIVFDPVAFPYKYYQVGISFAVEGIYSVRIEGTDTSATLSTIWESELIHVKQKHENTQLIKFSNNENDEDLYFDGGFKVLMRVEAHFYKRKPSASYTFFRDSDGRGQILGSTTQRKIELNLKNLPPFMHEMLAIGFSLSDIEINGGNYFCEAGYGEPEYSGSRYQRGNNTVVIEYKSGFNDKIVAGETFYLITELGDPIVTETNDNLIYQ